jgi:glutathione S-transferase
MQTGFGSSNGHPPAPVGKPPTLWHIAFSHYNEKARWALDHKGVEHERREALGGLHPLVSLWKTRGRSNTFPLLILDGKGIGDSTEIIAALERRWPEPPLYPERPSERERALELEDFFDEELAPYVRRLVFHEVIRDRAVLETFLERITHPRMRWGPARQVTVALLHARFGTRSDDAAEESKRKIVAALDRLESELGDGDYLVGDRFTVADLTAASLFYPLVLPPEGPRLGFRIPDAVLAFRDGLGRRDGLDWVKEMFRRHRAADRARVLTGAGAVAGG